MRGLVPLAILICVVNAYYDETLDYWYSNDDGLVKDNLVPFKRSNNNTLKKEIARSIMEVHHDLFSQRNEDLPTLRSWHRRRRPRFIRFPPILPIPLPDFLSAKKLKKGITWPAGDKHCTYGSSTKIYCNKCTCMAPMVYVCSSNLCDSKKKGKDVVRDKNEVYLRRECVDGAPVKSRECNHCICLGGKIVCTLMNCPVEKFKLKELTKLKNSVRERNGVQCNGNDPIFVECNRCWCIGNSIYCTMMRCDTGQSKLTLKTVPKLDKCQKGTWYSPTGDLNCRPCFCLDENISFCFAGHCSLNDQKQTIPELTAEESSKCVPGKKAKKGLCTLCTCNKKGHWVCYKNCDKDKLAKEDDAYVLGTQSSCHGCRYSNGVWDCYAAQTQCSDYDSTVQTSRTVFLNNKGPCSVCYPDPKNGNICASDVKCQINLYSKVKPIGECSSDAMCKKSCEKSKKRIGRCLAEKCVCF